MTSKITTLLAALTLALPLAARADITSDRAAAVLIFPKVLFSRLQIDAGMALVRTVTDTVIQITNTSDEPVALQCFYVNANHHCSLTELVCDPFVAGGLNPDTGGCPLDQDICLPGWTETDFELFLTPQQPIGWRASRGLGRDDLPLDGALRRGPTGESNSGSLVPPVSAEPSFIALHDNVEDPLLVFTGELKCVVVDGDGHPIARNVVKGEATITTQAEVVSEDSITREPRVEKYNALGVQAINGDANGDRVLELGGDAGEYNGCPQVLIVNHFFDFAVDGAGERLESELTLVPCSQNLQAQIPGSTTAQFLVFNEFEQRFSTSTRVDCLFKSLLSFIDTRTRERSIFSVFVAGTIAGQTRIRGVSGGLLGVLSESPLSAQFGTFVPDRAINLGQQGDRATADRIVLP